ncbi:TPA: LysR family transcriptional regulator [Pseudomonas aeruginosa]|uniref:LysR family transcriptional regulator n=2 Tax=Gammaproteobacteria TaxID=1236 RepID=A0A482U9J7_9PSED|nr:MULTISPECIES: LysR family transcriptional regulator [Pseudomonadaceae]RRU90148.1 LysR family transcriptional regulator [Stutzerimonas xanthomarina]RYJ58371.1 LysR family transcriptional regulator [Pseudomonas songnenensis]HCL3396500.1 LysR family transcriptional regulator [Pseudomonas aeruginosa]
MRNLRSLDLNLLRALDALLDEGSVTRAAERLALTQPAVSGMLTRLRESFDDPLFVRSQRGLVPTVRAQSLALPIKRVLGEIDGMLQPPEFVPGTAEFTLSIAATDYAQRTILVPLLAALREEAPGVRVSVRPVDGLRLEHQLASGELDMAIVTPDSIYPGLHARPLYDEQYVCVLRDDHPNADGFDLDDFCALDHALVSLGNGSFEGVTDEALAGLGRKRHVVLSVPSFLMLLEILRGSDLIAVVPKRLIQTSDGLRVLDPPVPIPGFQKVVAWHERTHHHPAHQWVRALLSTVCERS